MKTCNVGNTAYPLDSPECFGSGSLYSDDVKNNCRLRPSVNEDIGFTMADGFQQREGGGAVGGVLKALPGCNPIQKGPANATPQTGCGATDSLSGGSANTPGNAVRPSASSSVSSKAASSPSPSTTLTKVSTPVAPVVQKPSTTTSASSPRETSAQPTGSTSGSGSGASITVASGRTWTDYGCWSDAINPRSLGTQPEWYNVQISGTNCANHCDKIGMTISGTENGGQCFCGKELKNSKLSPGKCTIKCNGDKSQTCGGPGFLSVYKRSGSTKKSRSHRHLGKHQAAVS